MEKFIKLASLCKCSVSIEVNGHRDYYQSVQGYMDDVTGNFGSPRTTQDVLDEMIKRDTVVWVQFYPYTPIGFYCIYHYDIEIAMDEALKVIQEQQNKG